jgi:6-phosphogluconate dehydrogenase
MGSNLARNFAHHGYTVALHNRSVAKTDALLKEHGSEGNFVRSETIPEFLAALEKPRRVIIMVKAGDPTDAVINELADAMEEGDIIIDGGNSYYKDDLRRSKELEAKGIHYVDVGTSGGVWGLDRGYCMMIGGPKDVVRHLDPIFGTLAPGIGEVERTPGREGEPNQAERGYIHAGPAGAGHFVKMIHNGIEYGMMQAFAEGFDILRNKNSTNLPEAERMELNLADISEVWRRGSVVSSWLLDLTAAALHKDEALSTFSGFVQDSGEGRWTIEAAMEEAVPADVLSASLYARFRSRQEHTFGEKVLSAMRFAFGGHVEKPSGGGAPR